MSGMIIKRKKILSIVLAAMLAFVFLLSTTMSAEAAVSGYGHKVTLTDSGSFTVNVTGSQSSVGGITLKNWSTTSSNSFAYFTVERPNHQKFVNNVYVGHNSDCKLTFTNATPGIYTIYYNVYAPNGTELSCYIYY